MFRVKPKQSTKQSLTCPPILSRTPPWRRILLVGSIPSGAHRPSTVVDMSDDIVILGAAPRPTTDADLSSRLLTAVRDALPQGSNADALTVVATTDGDDIATLDVALTGVNIPNLTQDDVKDLLGSGELASSQPMVIRAATLRGEPLLVAGAKVAVSGQLSNLPGSWVETSDGRVGIQLTEPTDSGSPVTGSGAAEITKADLVTAATTVGQTMAAGLGVALSDLTIDLRQVSARQVQVNAGARVKKGFIGASAEVGATASIDQDMVVNISNLVVSSKNPVINTLLGVVRGKLDRFNNRTIAINQLLPAGVRLSALEFDVADSIKVKGTIG